MSSLCRVGLAPPLGHREPARGPIYGDGGPALTVLVRKVDQQSAVVVLDPEPVAGIPLFVKASNSSPRWRLVCDEGGPPATAW